ncbi:50S ribosomal protein L11 methyltransferase [Actinoalloteichus hymeniacidonis]|uniref:Methyltransferase family protein n=1 Tax=Actinoalloteichus hymeniacidonis TaxID=340345 RepID=A0AAC9HRI6_9PSEU|nr:50S ribosomal protein L11 methyltransferase [Actinoalloteichus hymeniacidonis]AOS64317.1 methyltransferase family protein [Actinoalloteichus hymeniacidonis]MBB5907615.1 hypothetical protein [Actinoalloteichus hymeniacidonis]
MDPAQRGIGHAIGRHALAASHAAGELMVVLLGRTWVVQDGVYSPTGSPSTELCTTALPYPAGGSFLEIGSGCGVTVVHALLHGCTTAVATDVTPQAVANTRLNAELHGVDDRLDVRSGSVFDPLDHGDRFDLVFWNAPSLLDAEDPEVSNALSRSYFDPGRQGLSAFLSGLRARLTQGGRAFLGFDDLGDCVGLRALAAEHGWRLRITACEVAPRRAVVEGRPIDVEVDHLLYELFPGRGPQPE